MNTTKLSNGIEVTQNFDWDITKRKICVFMPHHHDRKFTAFSLQQIATQVSKDDYVVIVGCDNTEDDFEEFEKDNIYFFSLKRPEGGSRNGCFVRNYAIKRCQSDLFFQKDGEVVMIGDFIQNCIDRNGSWRAGKIYVLDDRNTQRYMSTGNPSSFINRPIKIIDEIFPDSVEEVKRIIDVSTGQLNLTTYHHYACCHQTSVLQSINGYDEDFATYGYEDSDMFCRLYALGYKMKPDYSCGAVHLCHPRSAGIDDVSEMANLFREKDPKDPVRNPNGWGEGA